MNHRRRSQFFVAHSGVLVALLFSIPLIAQEATPPSQSQVSDAARQNVYKVGGGVLPPVPIRTVEPKFSKAVRKGKIKGMVLVNLYVEADGSPSNVHVTRMNLSDEKGRVIPDAESTPDGQDLARMTVDAVNQYRFKPATKNGTPVKIEMYVEVNIKL